MILNGFMILSTILYAGNDEINNLPGYCKFMWNVMLRRGY